MSEWVGSLPETRAIVREDLRALLSDRELAFRIEKSPCDIRCENDTDRAALHQLLLGILTFSYAAGCYASDEIENSLYDNPAATQVHDLLFKNESPSAVLRRFRRSHRRQIERSLARMLQLTCSDHGLLAADYQEEAAKRVSRAIMADCWALEV